MQLLNFTTKSGHHINIVKHTAAHYRNIGISLLQDTTGNIIQEKVIPHMNKSVEISLHIYRRWLMESPTASWSELIKCLKINNFDVIAQEIEETLGNRMYILHYLTL